MVPSVALCLQTERHMGMAERSCVIRRIIMMQAMHAWV